MKTFFAVITFAALISTLSLAQPLPQSKGGVNYCCVDGKHACHLGDWSPGVGCFCSEPDGGYGKAGVTCK
jgi:hypothetical protein